jgi:hypothetical protein
MGVVRIVSGFMFMVVSMFMCMRVLMIMVMGMNMIRRRMGRFRLSGFHDGDPSIF